jgi:hypothetical protein
MLIRSGQSDEKCNRPEHVAFMFLFMLPARQCMSNKGIHININNGINYVVVPESKCTR